MQLTAAIPQSFLNASAHLISFDLFLQLYRHVFEHCLKDMQEKLFIITECGCIAAQYALEFDTIAAGSWRNEKALKATFHKGLKEDILTELEYHHEEATLNSLINLA